MPVSPFLGCPLPKDRLCLILLMSDLPCHAGYAAGTQQMLIGSNWVAGQTQPCGTCSECAHSAPGAGLWEAQEQWNGLSFGLNSGFALIW